MMSDFLNEDLDHIDLDFFLEDFEDMDRWGPTELDIREWEYRGNW
jgi:hypothetical protein